MDTPQPHRLSPVGALRQAPESRAPQEAAARGESPRTGLGSDAGSVTLFVIVAAVALLVLLGLIVDGGGKIRALQRADRLAEEAARAAGQAINAPAAISGQPLLVDAEAAATAARAYLVERHVSGSVEADPAGRALRVRVQTEQPTVVLALIGIRSMPVTGQASVSLLTSPNGGDTP